MVHIHDEICEENGDFRLAFKRVELENTPLSEVTQMQKYCMFCLFYCPWRHILRREYTTHDILVDDEYSAVKTYHIVVIHLSVDRHPVVSKVQF